MPSLASPAVPSVHVTRASGWIVQPRGGNVDGQVTQLSAFTMEVVIPQQSLLCHCYYLRHWDSRRQMMLVHLGTLCWQEHEHVGQAMIPLNLGNSEI